MYRGGSTVGRSGSTNYHVDTCGHLLNRWPGRSTRSTIHVAMVINRHLNVLAKGHNAPDHLIWTATLTVGGQKSGPPNKLYITKCILSVRLSLPICLSVCQYVSLSLSLSVCVCLCLSLSLSSPFLRPLSFSLYLSLTFPRALSRTLQCSLSYSIPISLGLSLSPLSLILLFLVPLPSACQVWVHNITWWWHECLS